MDDNYPQAAPSDDINYINFTPLLKCDHISYLTTNIGKVQHVMMIKLHELTDIFSIGKLYFMK